MKTAITGTIVATLVTLAACGGDEFSSSSQADAGVAGQGGAAGQAGATGHGGTSGAAGASGHAGAAGTAGAAGLGGGGTAQGGASGAGGSSGAGAGGGQPGNGGSSPGGFCEHAGPHYLCTDFESGAWGIDWGKQLSGGELEISSTTAVSAPNSLQVTVTPAGGTGDLAAQLVRSVHVNGAGPTHVHVVTNFRVSATPSPYTPWVGLVEIQLGTVNTWFGWRNAILAVWTEDLQTGTISSPATLDAISVGQWHLLSLDIQAPLGSDLGTIAVQLDAAPPYAISAKVASGTNLPANVLIGVREVGGDEQQVWFDNVLVDRE